MSEITISFDKQVAELFEELRNLGKEIEAEADEEISAFIDDTFIPTLKHNSPASDDNQKNKYRDGWVKKKDSKSKYYRVSNKNRPDLTYMLEYGFEQTYKLPKRPRPKKDPNKSKYRDDERIIRRADSQKHIRPTIEQTEQTLINRLKNKLGGI